MITGGGSKLKHMKQLVEYVTGMDCRIGYPNEHVSKAPSEEMLMPYLSTGVGLVIDGLQKSGVGNSFEKKEEQTTTSTKEDVTVLRDKQNSRRGTAGFLSRIKEFFDAEEE